jgi:hypothetical protein
LRWVRQRIFEHGEAVVLARDLDAPVLQAPDRMVRPVVPERHLVRLATEGEPQQLVAQADAEDRNLA